MDTDEYYTIQELISESNNLDEFTVRFADFFCDKVSEDAIESFLDRVGFSGDTETLKEDIVELMEVVEKYE